MAKKVSKHSRAARRGLEDDVSHEAKELSSIPKEENSDVKKSIIRTTIKNENLLNKKIENKRIKKLNRKSTSSLKHKTERSSKIEGILNHKIQQSMERAKYVQNARKSGWERINKDIQIKNDVHDELNEQPKITQEQEDQMEEDAYVEDFYKDGCEDHKDGSEDHELPSSANKFALLEETEA
ncbi:hypothetical protein HYPBUDRAFT_153996 [Hyphopichia burtonii NRRL Y-1933]|uniref:Alb1-domain-containing protein n=1 Tax=Hyphopichia burtonii NRRL Y-1933 TaxID=984485 RepID=A0A1E4RD03_9ASCO|nr:hypothetical protein HYPBUDRAFT_153996 [Hyphopichia burtonii NRRL Y-1933]ODV65116.1 hypothetical protein HYPBUDRAFT_153996 [Hyphopichia burtonii NRRL Y-1933]